jgi:hypothetical protein
MPTLNIGGSATLKIYVKFNAKADKWFVRGTEGEEKEIERPTFVIDFPNLATGWLRFREGQAPERVMDPTIDRHAPKPGEGFKRGFVVMAYSPKFFGGAAEFASNAIHLGNAIKDAYALYEKATASNPGKLPVLQCVGSQPMKDRHGTNYRPTFTIVEWVDRPADLPSVSPVETADIWHGSSTVDAKPASPSLSDPVF